MLARVRRPLVGPLLLIAAGAFLAPARTALAQPPAARRPATRIPAAQRQAIVAARQVAVPELRSLFLPAARDSARRAGLVVAVRRAVQPGLTRVAMLGRPGQVIAQEPAAGTPVARGSTVLVDIVDTLRQDTTRTRVPHVVGMKLALARAVLARYGLLAAPQSQATDDAARDSVVLAQQPDSGATAKRGGSVLLTVARYAASEVAFVVVPDVVGLPLREAADTMRVHRLAARVGTPDAEPADRVASQQPAAGDTVRPRSTVALYTPAMALVPTLVGKPLGVAEAEVRGAKLVPRRARVSPPAEEHDTVTAQKPGPETRVSEGSAVVLVTPARVTVPLVVAQPWSAAVSLLSAAQLQPRLDPAARSPEPADTVTSQWVRAGARVPPNTIVTLTPAERATVPRVVGLTPARARGLLGDSLVAVAAGAESTSADSAGLVTWQSLRAGTRVARGESVRLRVGVARAAAIVPPAIVPPTVAPPVVTPPVVTPPVVTPPVVTPPVVTPPRPRPTPLDGVSPDWPPLPPAPRIDQRNWWLLFWIAVAVAALAGAGLAWQWVRGRRRVVRAPERVVRRPAPATGVTARVERRGATPPVVRRHGALLGPELRVEGASAPWEQSIRVIGVPFLLGRDQ